MIVRQRIFEKRLHANLTKIKKLELLRFLYSKDLSGYRLQTLLRLVQDL